MTTVYVVTNGEYSDMRVMAVCSTRERADALAAAFTDGDVEAFELDAFTVPPEMRFWEYKAWASPDSYNYGEPVARGNDEWIETEEWKDAGANMPYGTAPRVKTFSSEAYVYLWAASKEEAEKIGAEVYAKYLAEKDIGVVP